MTAQEAFTRAFQHHQAGRLKDAEALYRQVLDIQPDHAEARHFLGVLAHQAGRHDLAIEWIGQAIALAPHDPAAHSNLGEAYRSAGRLEEAIASYRRALELNPGFALAHNNLGLALAGKGQWEEAVAAYRRALAIQPGYAEAHGNLGVALRDRGLLDEAIAAHHRALELNPHDPPAHNNLGIVLKDRGQLDEAEAAYRRALELQPGYARAKFNLALLLLLRGDYERGWPLYEARWSALRHAERQFSQPRWDGNPLPGQRVLVHAEQGLGDSIQFIRYAPLIAGDGGEVIVQCQRSLVELFRKARGIKTVVGGGDVLPPFDAHLPMLSLPLVFKTTLESIPLEVPYLFADPVRRKVWSERLSRTPRRPRVGLAWAGNPEKIRLQERHIPLPELEPLLGVENVDFFSLQVGHGTGQLRQFAGAATVVDYTEHLQDFADTAAFLMELDLIISVDTAVAHLAGALGRPVWTLLAFVADWRWDREEGPAPWYPTMRLFRQPAPGQWAPVVRRVAEELREVVAQRPSPSAG